MVIVPDSDIILIKSPLKLDNSNQITFASASAQEVYFKSLPHLEYDGCTYQRKDGVIRYATNNAIKFENLITYNYCMYKNDSYSDKWFYAFITDCKYINDGLTEVSIETDAFQTWQFDIQYMNSFIEREHVGDDTIGLHTVPEGLETGEYIVNETGVVSNLLRRDGCYVCVGLSYIPSNTPNISLDRYYGNIYSGLYQLVMQSFTDASKIIQAYADIGRVDAIFSVYMIPSSLVDIGTWHKANLGNQTDIHFSPLPSSIASKLIQSDISLPLNNSLNTYVPKNNKLYVFPFNYLSITNNCGTQAEFHYEDFVNNAPLFDLIGLETAGIPCLLIPKNYKLYGGSQGSVSHKYFYNYGITSGKFPMCSWQSDLYTNWMTSNGMNIMGHKIDAATTQAIGGSLQALTGAATLSGEAIGSGLGTMFGAVQEQYRHSLQSPRVEGETTVGDLSFANDQLTFTYYKFSIKREYAEIIDNFFSMYGYKVNRLATPNIHKRLNWDYIKTIDVNLEGNIPEKDLTTIRNLFNNGCTFWHNTNTFLNYSASNTII